MKILHLGKKGNVEKYLPHQEYLKGIELVDLPITASIEEILNKASDARYLIADAIAPVPGELIRKMPQLKMIHSEGVAYNFFDIEAAKECGVYVCNCKGMNAMAVAEQTVLLMLGLLRDVTLGDQAVRQGRQIEVKEGYMVRGDLYELADFPVGLIGFGDIGKCVAGLMRAFGAKTYYYSRHRADEETEKTLGVSYLSLEELCRKCRIFSVHVPVTRETQNMIDKNFFQKIPKGSYLINTARGEVVDSQALVEAIKAGIIKKAALDTIVGEPVKGDNVLVDQPPEILEHLLFSPHIGGITASSFRRGYEMVWEDIRALEEGRRPMRVVNNEI